MGRISPVSRLQIWAKNRTPLEDLLRSYGHASTPVNIVQTIPQQNPNRILWFHSLVAFLALSFAPTHFTIFSYVAVDVNLYQVL